MNKYSVLVSCVVTVIVFLTAGPALAGTAEEDAVQAAEKWLALVDAGDYSASWEQSGELLKKAVTVEQWAQAMEATRTPLGDLVSREVLGSKYATSLPGAPDGEYVVIQFKSSFANKKEAVETVTPKKDSEGVWRVSGYFIK